MSSQLPLGFRFAPDQCLATYVTARAGDLALLQAVAQGTRGDWLLLSGPPGSGKTHLLIAACAEAGEQGRDARYLPLRKAGDVEAMLAGAEAAALVALDDLDAVLGSRAGEVALFDFHNRARSAGCTLLYAAAAPASALPCVLPDLRSRLAQCTQLALALPDEAMRRELLRRRAARRGLSLDEDVLEFLFRRVGRDLPTLSALLDRIDRESLASQRRVTIPFLRTLL